jgi:hypothetical protein
MMPNENRFGNARAAVFTLKSSRHLSIISIKIKSRMRHTISVTDSNISLVGEWETVAQGLRHAHLTDHLTDSLTVEWLGGSLIGELSSSTGRKIAVVVTLDEQPISAEKAGAAIRWGEGQSYIFVEQHDQYELVKEAAGDHRVSLLTHSDKLVVHSFSVNED